MRVSLNELLVGALVSVAVGTAVWLAPASVHIIGWTGDHALRVAFLPPLSRLGWAVGIVGLTGLAWILSAERFGFKTASVSSLAPLALLLAWALPYLPWLPARFPLLLLLSGPMRWCVAALAVAWCLWRIAPRQQLRWPTRLHVGRRVVCACTLIVFLAVGLSVRWSQGYGGDEPHYLIITHSLLADGDLRIENNHRAGDYSAFFDGTLDPHFQRRGQGGVIYSIHAPGLPAVLLPGYAVFGHLGALAVISLLAALAALAVFDLADAVASRASALITWAAVIFSVPFGVHAWMIYPEMAAAAVTAWAALWIWTNPSRSCWGHAWQGSVLAILPWLHTKFALLLAGLTVAMVIRLWPRVAACLAVLAPIAVSGMLWLASFAVMYGVADPTAPYNFTTGLDIANMTRGTLGLLFDQEYGLLIYSPVYLLAAAGWVRMAREPDQRWLVFGLTGIGAAFVVTVSQVDMWWGGSSAPARFLVPALPFAVPMIAVAFDRPQTSLQQGIAGLLFAASLASFATVVFSPAQRLLFNDRDGSGRLVEAMQADAPLAQVLPSFVEPSWQTQVPSLLTWLAAAAVAMVLSRVVCGRLLRGGPFMSATITLFVFGATGSALSAALVPNTDKDAVAAVGRMNLLAAFPGDTMTAVRYSPLRATTPSAVLDSAVIRSEPTPRAQEGHEIIGPLRLAPGRYEARVRFLPGAPVGGELSLRYGRGPAVLARTPIEGTHPAALPFELPISVAQAVLVASDPSVAPRTSVVEIVPLEVVPRSQRLVVQRPRAVEPAPGRQGGHVLYVDDNIYPEGGGSWVRGGRRGRLVVLPAGARALRINVQNGATPGPVWLQVGGEDRTLELGSFETQELDFELRGAERSLPVVVFPREGFRPAEFDPASDDRRWLGARVAIHLR